MEEWLYDGDDGSENGRESEQRETGLKRGKRWQNGMQTVGMLQNIVMEIVGYGNIFKL